MSVASHWSLLVLVFLAVAVHGQADGNPHNWDRKRRCDSDYAPACGVCEGVGGIPYGDANDQIHLTSCTAVANASDVSHPVHPVWGETFTVPFYNEVLIGPKTDPFCFTAFPSNSSEGKLCYRSDSGRQVYDAVNAGALRYDLDVKTSVGNVTTTIVHQGRNMWIVNHLPWYAAGVHQCICTEIHQGSDKTTPGMYPVAYNWTQQMHLLGREQLGVEYMADGHTEVLDHWGFGPHHVWSVPGTGEIRRMWQPFNGLQVFPQGTTNATVDPSLFEDIPPKLCMKKGGAILRTGCTDGGMPQNNTAAGATAAKAKAKVEAGPKASEVARAANPRPRAAYRGDGFADMSSVLNRWLQQSPHARGRTKPCNEWRASDLQQLQALLYLVRDESFDAIYQDAGDNRRLRGSMEALRADWAALNDLVSGHPTHEAELHGVLRDGHCHEAVMWYVHHLTDDMRQLLAEKTDVTIPLLSAVGHGARCAEAGLAHLGGGVAGRRVCSAYTDQVTCASCHSNVVPPGHEFLRAKV